MENTNSKWFAAGISMLIIMSLFSITQMLRVARAGGSIDEFLVVSMPRPIKEMLFGLSLEGRKVVREIEGDLDDKLKRLNKTMSKPSKRGTQAAVDKGQRANQQKRNTYFAKQTQLHEMRRKAFQARVVEEAERYRRSLMAERQQSYEEQKTLEAFQAWAKKESQNAGPAGQKNEENRERRSSAEWMSLILAQPTQENVGEMIKALATGEIEVSTYLEISEKLIRDNSQEKKRLGIWALTSIYRREAFALAAHLAVDAEVNTQTLLRDYMFSYNQTQRLSVFEQVLKSQDAVAAAAAAQAISRSISAIQSGNPNQAANNVRGSGSRNGTAVQQLSLRSYQSLVPTLRFVADKNLHNLSQWAHGLLSQLQTLSTTA